MISRRAFVQAVGLLVFGMGAFACIGSSCTPSVYGTYTNGKVTIVLKSDGTWTGQYTSSTQSGTFEVVARGTENYVYLTIVESSNHTIAWPGSNHIYLWSGDRLISIVGNQTLVKR